MDEEDEHSPSEFYSPEDMGTCKPPEVHFTIRNRVPYNKQLTNRACSGRSGEYWPSVVAVEVRTATTEGQYSPLRPEQARLVSGSS